jgi:hypothetical protein
MNENWEGWGRVEVRDLKNLKIEIKLKILKKILKYKNSKKFDLLNLIYKI